MAASARRRERRLRAQDARRLACRPRQQGAPVAPAGAARRRDRPLSARALRRTAATRRARPRDRLLPADPPVRRAALEPRCAIARGDAGRTQGHPPFHRRHRRLRDPRPGRGDEPVGHHRGDGGGRDPPGRVAARALRGARRRARGPLRRQGQYFRCGRGRRCKADRPRPHRRDRRSARLPHVRRGCAADPRRPVDQARGHIPQARRRHVAGPARSHRRDGLSRQPVPVSGRARRRPHPRSPADGHRSPGRRRRSRARYRSRTLLFIAAATDRAGS
jgi:hypothetical protein